MWSGKRVTIELSEKCELSLRSRKKCVFVVFFKNPMKRHADELNQRRPYDVLVRNFLSGKNLIPSFPTMNSRCSVPLFGQTYGQIVAIPYDLASSPTACSMVALANRYSPNVDVYALVDFSTNLFPKIGEGEFYATNTKLWVFVKTIPGGDSLNAAAQYMITATNFYVFSDSMSTGTNPTFGGSLSGGVLSQFLMDVEVTETNVVDKSNLLTNVPLKTGIQITSPSPEGMRPLPPAIFFENNCTFFQTFNVSWSIPFGGSQDPAPIFFTPLISPSWQSGYGGSVPVGKSSSSGQPEIPGIIYYFPSLTMSTAAPLCTVCVQGLPISSTVRMLATTYFLSVDESTSALNLQAVQQQISLVSGPVVSDAFFSYTFFMPGSGNATGSFVGFELQPVLNQAVTNTLIVSLSVSYPMHAEQIERSFVKMANMATSQTANAEFRWLAQVYPAETIGTFVDRFPPVDMEFWVKLQNDIDTGAVKRVHKGDAAMFGER